MRRRTLIKRTAVRVFAAEMARRVTGVRRPTVSEEFIDQAERDLRGLIEERVSRVPRGARRVTVHV